MLRLPARGKVLELALNLIRQQPALAGQQTGKSRGVLGDEPVEQRLFQMVAAIAPLEPACGDLTADS